jgi:anti-sigma factor RsiW
MNDADKHLLVARALKGGLRTEEQRDFERRLQSDLALRQYWESERALDRAFNSLPDAPVASNFTNLVLQEAARATGPARARKKSSIRWMFARFAAGLAAVTLLSLGVLQQRQNAHRLEVAETVNALHHTAMAVSSTEAADTEIFQNFDTIQQLSLPAESEMDLELLLALQK